MKKELAVLVAVLVSACGGDARVTSNDPFCQRVLPTVEAFLGQARAANPVPNDERYGGTVVMGGIGELRGGMNPVAPIDHSAIQHHQFVNLMTLIDYDENFDARPYLAESWDVSEDQSEITFHLRRDVVWHDGEQTDAHDVAFTYRTVMNPAVGFGNPAYWDHYDKSAEGIEVIDDFTVRMRLRPHAEFLDPWRSVAILPEHLLGDVPAQELAEHPFGTQCPVGNGPFVFDSHSPSERWVFVANPAFPQGLGGRPFYDRYIFRVIPDQTALLTELMTESIDAYITVRPNQAQQIIDNPNVDFLNFRFRNFVMVAWNARRPQLADPRVRRAITMATNREEIVQAIQGGYAVVANSSVPPFHWAYRGFGAEDMAYNAASAAALLDEAGWIDRDGDGVRENADGLPLAVSIKYNTGNQERQDIAEILQAQLGGVGIRVTPEVVDFGALLGQISDPDSRDFDGVVMGWVPEFKLDDMDLFHSARTNEPNAWTGTDNPEIDRLLEALSFSVDRDETARLWAEYEVVLNEEHPFTFFYFPDRLTGVNKRVRGVHMDARGEWTNLKDWYLDPERR